MSLHSFFFVLCDFKMQKNSSSDKINSKKFHDWWKDRYNNLIVLFPYVLWSRSLANSHLKAQLEKELTAKLQDLERQQKIERDDFEKTLSANQEENDCVRKEFEQKLSNEKAEMLKRSDELELKMKEKVEEEERKLKVLLQERDNMIELLQSEKEKAEVRMEEERKLFDEKISNLEGNFKNIEKEKSKVWTKLLA